MDMFFKFDKGSYSTRSKYLDHEWFISQAEISTNVKFKSPKFCTSLFEKLLQKVIRLGLPDRICQIFGKRRTGKGSKSTWRLYDNNACIRNWHGKNSIKFYNKSGDYLRVETTINDPKSLGVRLKKALYFLPQYLWVGMRCNERFYDCCADVDPSGLDEGQIDRFNQTIPDAKGNPVPAPDLRKARQAALFRELLKPKYCSFGFNTKVLLRALRLYFQNPAQIRYELRKLRERGVIRKRQDKNLYVVTTEGWKYLWTAICAWMHFRNPMLARVFKHNLENPPTQPTEIDQAFSQIDAALSQILQALALVS
jgi:DNA-binding PadR family transcriptional regulator